MYTKKLLTFALLFSLFAQQPAKLAAADTKPLPAIVYEVFNGNKLVFGSITACLVWWIAYYANERLSDEEMTPEAMAEEWQTMLDCPHMLEKIKLLARYMSRHYILGSRPDAPEGTYEIEDPKKGTVKIKKKIMLKKGHGVPAWVDTNVFKPLEEILKSTAPLAPTIVGFYTWYDLHKIHNKLSEVKKV